MGDNSMYVDKSSVGMNLAQAPHAVVMIRPHHFESNPQTFADNTFQSREVIHCGERVAQAAYDEVSQVALHLRAAGVTVHLFEDEGRDTPDSCFPNNWFSTHHDGRIVLYPMASLNRRRERRMDIIKALKRDYQVLDIIDYSDWEDENIFLEGTGSLVLDHIQGRAYAARSLRTHEVALERFCAQMGYESQLFDAQDRMGRPIYHTNVMMCIGTTFVMIGLDTIPHPKQREQISQLLRASGREIVELSQDQIAEFAGNALELTGSHGPLLVLSTRAWGALGGQQQAALESHAAVLPMAIPTIELAGGSLRCMLAGIHLLS